MYNIALFFIILTAFLHAYFLVLEMFLWTKPFGQRLFKMSADMASATSRLAANQGLYNGLLALGLGLSLCIPDPTAALTLRRYCLSFIIAVGIYGAYSLRNRKVFVIQALPAIIALTAGELARA